jgi:hypothetical protein
MDGSAAKMRNVVLMGTSHKHQLAGNTSEVAFRDFGAKRGKRSLIGASAVIPSSLPR